MSEAATFSLSQEELLYLLRLLKIPTLPGISPKAWSEIPDSDFAVMLGAGERSLQARELLRLEGDQWVLEVTVAGILGFCLRPTYGLLVKRTVLGEDLAQSVIYHLSARLHLKHHAINGVHHFTLFPDSAAVFENIQNMILGDDMNEASEYHEVEFEVPTPALLLTAIGRHTESESDTINRLQQLGMSGPVVTELTRIMRHELVSTSIVGVWRTPEDETPPTTFGILQSANQWWLLTTKQLDSVEPKYLINSIRFDMLREYLSETLAKFL